MQVELEQQKIQIHEDDEIMEALHQRIEQLESDGNSGQVGLSSSSVDKDTSLVTRFRESERKRVEAEQNIASLKRQQAEYEEALKATRQEKEALAAQIDSHTKTMESKVREAEAKARAAEQKAQEAETKVQEVEKKVKEAPPSSSPPVGASAKETSETEASSVTFEPADTVSSFSVHGVVSLSCLEVQCAGSDT